jgi:DNA polymerase (family 10)
MTKEEIAGVLEQIATLLELKGENQFKIRAYTNAARATPVSTKDRFSRNE